MDAAVKRDIEDVLNQAYGAIKSERYFYLHGLSDHVIHSLAIYKTPEIGYVATMVYCLSKIFLDEKYTKRHNLKKFREEILVLLDDARTYIKKDQIKAYMKTIIEASEMLEKFTTDVKEYSEDLMVKARIHKGTRIYEHGMSLGSAAKTLGVTSWDIMDYGGKTTISEYQKSKHSITAL